MSIEKKKNRRKDIFELVILLVLLGSYAYYESNKGEYKRKNTTELATPQPSMSTAPNQQPQSVFLKE